MRGTINRASAVVAVLAAAAVLAGCWERPPIESVQRGYRGTGMVQVFNPRTLTERAAIHEPPAQIAEIPPGGPLARDAYQNVQVLGDLDVGSFTRLMVAMTAWVSPQQSCNYCHAGGNFASDDLYTKKVARRMLEMTRHINANWKSHVGETGVNCYTCHRGKPVPANWWTLDPATGVTPEKFAGWRNGQNRPSTVVGLASLPADPFTPYFVRDGQVRVNATQALPSDHRASIQHTEWTYSLMVHMAEGLGVNCTYCHNSRNFAGWDGAPPQRVTAWHGIRMVRDLNVDYLSPLQPVYPPERLGVTGDAPKANCATCHYGAFKPMYGAPMVQGFPALVGTTSK